MDVESEISRRRDQLLAQNEKLRGIKPAAASDNPAPKYRPRDRFQDYKSSIRPPQSPKISDEQPPSPSDQVHTSTFSIGNASASLSKPPQDDAHTLPSSALVSSKSGMPVELLGEDGYVTDFNRLSVTEGDSSIDGLGAGVHLGSGKDKNSPLSYQCSMMDVDVTKSRCVSAVKFHPKYDDVVFTAHASRTDGKLGESGGTLALWGLDGGRAALQRSMLSNSPVTALELPSLSPTLVIGGTRCGNVLLWDTRVKTTLPVNTMGGDGCDLANSHGRQAVTALKTTTTPSPVFFSASTSGYLCKWSLSMPDRPVSRSIIQDAIGASELMMSCIDFPHTARFSADDRASSNRNASVYAGSLDGGIYRLDANSNSWNMNEGRGVHEAQVTAISSHPFGDRSPYLDNVIVSSARDWTIRLWHFGKGKQCEELASYDMISTGTVHDVAWSPQYATVCCAGDESGMLSLIDVSGHLLPRGDSPLCQFSIPNRDEKAAISKVEWGNNGRILCAGNQDGRSTIWRCESAFAALPGFEWMAQYMKANYAEDS